MLVASLAFMRKLITLLGVLPLICCVNVVVSAGEQMPFGRAEDVWNGRYGPEAVVKPGVLTPAQSRQAALQDFYERLRTGNSEDSARAAEAIEKLWLQSGSETVDLLMQRGLAAINNKDYAIAIKILSSVVALTPSYAEGWAELATARFLKGELSQAVTAYMRAITLDPYHYKAIEGYAKLMRQMGNKRAALDAFRRALIVNPHLQTARQAEAELSRELEGQRI